jgi:hypothetical protein
MEDKKRLAIRRYLTAESDLIEAVRPFFEDSIVLTEERKQAIKALFAERDAARDAYEALL